jgi:hypothetical protein
MEVRNMFSTVVLAYQWDKEHHTFERVLSLSRRWYAIRTLVPRCLD